MKKAILTIIYVVISTTLIIAQDQDSVSFYSGNIVDIKKGIQLKSMNEYLILSGISNIEKKGSVEVFLKRGNDAVSVKEMRVVNETLMFRLKDVLNGKAEFKSGDELVIKLGPKEIYKIPIH